MDFKTMLNNFIKNYFIIFSGVMIATFIYCSFLAPDATFDLKYFRDVFLLSFMGDLPGWIYYSPNPISKTQYNVRTIIHTVLLLGVLMLVGYRIGIYNNFIYGMWYAVSIIAVDIFVRLMGYNRDIKMAEEINKKLRESRRNLR